MLHSSSCFYHPLTNYQTSGRGMGEERGCKCWRVLNVQYQPRGEDISLVLCLQFLLRNSFLQAFLQCPLSECRVSLIQLHAHQVGSSLGKCYCRQNFFLHHHSLRIFVQSQGIRGAAANTPPPATCPLPSIRENRCPTRQL